MSAGGRFGFGRSWVRIIIIMIVIMMIMIAVIIMVEIYGHHEEYSHKKAEVGWRRKVCCESWVWIIIGTLPTSAFLVRPTGMDDISIIF